MKKRILLILSITFMFLLFVTSCGAAHDSGKDSYAPGDSYESGTSDGRGDASNGQGQGGDYTVMPGQLTACAYDDNKHFSFWQGLQYSSEQATSQNAGQFYNYFKLYSFNTTNRVKIKVPAGLDALVHLIDAKQNIVYTSVPDANGVAYLFSETDSDVYNIMLEYTKPGESEVTKQYEVVTSDTEFTFEATSYKREFIQLMFVIDTTGSMGDEIKYLKSEMVDIISKVQAEYRNAEIELAVMVYRDRGDAYVTKYSDFTTDIDAQKEFLAKQNANGGGDFPEAVHTALEKAANSQWAKDAKTKILIHVADAPAHDADVNSWNSSARTLASKGVRIITVASSGIDKKTEYFFRCQSIMTNGTYVYLTDDSGIGNSHLEATVEEKPVVEYLNNSLVRLIKGYHTGIFEDPIHYGQVNNQQ